MNTLMRSGSRLTAVLAFTLILLAGALAAAPSAAAETVCGYNVGGEIGTKYQNMGGVKSPLGCPKNNEIPLPDGVGVRQVFDGGTMYWSPETGAHPVWGAIGNKWGEKGWEGGSLGYPISDELNNPDGVGKRQQFEHATIYWHPAHGAHPVFGNIGWMWAKLNYERGSFGYPTSDETWDSNNKWYYQTYSGRPGAKIWATVGQTTDLLGCDDNSYCIGYRADAPNEPFYDKAQYVYDIVQDRWVMSVFPTSDGRDNADRNYEDSWNRMWNIIGYADGSLKTQQQYDSMYKQFACHAKYAYDLPGFDPAGGDSWDLESNTPDIGWDTALGRPTFLTHHCNW